MTPHYWNDAKKHLSKNCPAMKKLIGRYRGEGLRARGNGFYTLLRAVVGQQISVKAADSVWAKFEKAVKPLTPQKLLSMPDEKLRACGLSASKVAYVKNVATFYVARGIGLRCSPLEGERDVRLSFSHIRGGTTPAHYPPPPRSRARRLPLKGGVTALEAAYWNNLSDEEVIAELTSIKGIGSWTAEMFLIFHLLRPDVFPVKDLAVLKAMNLHYVDGQRLKTQKWLKPAEYQAIAQIWSPYRTVATWYLWRSLDPVAVEY